jgi:hypothetical protein
VTVIADLYPVCGGFTGTYGRCDKSTGNIAEAEPEAASVSLISAGWTLYTAKDVKVAVRSYPLCPKCSGQS